MDSVTNLRTFLAVVQHAGLPQERQLLTQLGRLADDATAQGFGSPAIVLVGDGMERERLAERIAAGDALLVLRTRVVRQVTIGKQRFRLALELHIEDNGPGVPEDIRDRIFYPLVSGRDGGSGLGLTLAQTFVQQHQGTIECDSTPGRTVFKIWIPLP